MYLWEGEDHSLKANKEMDNSSYKIKLICHKGGDKENSEFLMVIKLMPSANQLDAPTVLDLHVLYDWTVAVILLKIAMISPGTHFIKNQESQSRINESQSKS